MDIENQLPPAPVAEELEGEPAGKVRDDAMMHNQAMVEFYPGKRPRIGEPLYTHPQPAVPDVDALAEYLRGIDPVEDNWPMHTQNLAGTVCNWIEEQKQPAETKSQWIDWEEALPELHKLVLVRNSERWMNTPDDMDANWHCVGYLTGINGHQYFASLDGSRGICIEAVTDWMYLPETQQ